MRNMRNNRIISALVLGGLLGSNPMTAGAYAYGKTPTAGREAVQILVPQRTGATAEAEGLPAGGISSDVLLAQAGPTDPAAAGSNRKAPRIPSNAKINFDFTDYDLGELTKRISEMTGKNFILTEPLTGKKVTIMSPTKITLEEAYQVYLSVLRSAGYTVVPIGNSLKVVPLQQVSSEAVPTVIDPTGKNENFVTRLIKVANIDVDQIAGALSKLASPNGSMITYPPTNTLIMTDTSTNIERIVDIINRLDVESPTEQLVLIPIRYAAAADMADKLMQVYGDESGGTAARATRNQAQTNRRTRRNQPAPQQPAGPTSMGEDTPQISKIIADERTNSLIILATEKALEDIRALISKLDVDVNENLKSDIYVYYLNYAKAEELASTLANLASGTAGGGGQFPRQQTTTRPGSTTRTGSATNFGRAGQTGTAGSRSSGFSFGGAGDSPVATFEGGVRITADPPTNALVITASASDYRTLRRVIERLDIRRKQVFVEAVILELTQDKQKNTGVNFHAPFPGAAGGGGLLARGSGSLLFSDPSVLSGMAVGMFGATIEAPAALANGLAALTGSDSGTVEIPSFGVVLQALQQDQDVNILSTPSIMTSNNQEAKIVVGENVPFQSGSTISTIGSNISITREDVALTLRLTPQVNESEEVTLQVFQEITEVVPGTANNPLGPTTTKRQAETVVSVPDNQTVVIGGLISAKETYAEDKVPILGDIPLLGVLFRTKNRTVTKSNLLIFLTPHIIETEEDLQNVYRIKMAQRQEFIRRFYGKSREQQLKELDSLLRFSMNLPEIPPVYPERVKTRPQESLIETTERQRGFVVPIPGADPNQKGPVIVPVLPENGAEGAAPPGGIVPPSEGNPQTQPQGATQGAPALPPEVQIVPGGGGSPLPAQGK